MLHGIITDIRVPVSRMLLSDSSIPPTRPIRTLLPRVASALASRPAVETACQMTDGLGRLPEGNLLKDWGCKCPLRVAHKPLFDMVNEAHGRWMGCL